uniref:MATE family efflux transporter n=1 Tax=Megasphaera elsdenii TaxID=907 RepID=UPI003FEF27AA
MTESFLKGTLVGQLFRFALPVAFTIICEQLVNGTDVFVLGKFVGPAAMAAVGNDVPVVSLLISLLVGLSLGTNVTLAQAVGARKEAAARKILHTSLLFSVLIGLVFAGIGEIIVRPLLALLAVPPQVLAEAEPICAFSYIRKRRFRRPTSMDPSTLARLSTAATLPGHRPGRMSSSRKGRTIVGIVIR